MNTRFIWLIWLTPAEAAAEYHLPEADVLDLIQRNKVQAVDEQDIIDPPKIVLPDGTPPRKWRVNRDSLGSWLAYGDGPLPKGKLAYRIRLACTCDREDADGVRKIPRGWVNVERATDNESVLVWWDYLGECPDCKAQGADHE